MSQFAPLYCADEQVVDSALALCQRAVGEVEHTHGPSSAVDELNGQLRLLADQRRQELAEKERLSHRMEGLLQALPAGVVVLDLKGYVTCANPAAEELLGGPLEGALWRDVIYRAFAPRVDDGHEISLRDGRRISIQTRSLEGEEGQLLLLNDLTHTRELQRRLARQDRLSSMGRMMASLAHQLRTPLSTALLYASHLRDQQLDDQQRRKFADRVLSRLKNLEQQIRDMLIFARGDVKLTDQVASSELLMGVYRQAEALHGSDRVHLDDQGCGSFLLCQRDVMEGALLNLVNNAIEASSPGQVVRLSLSVEHEQVIFTVEDRGAGIAPELLQRLEEPFVTTKRNGTGLGLAVVRAVSVAHHGRFQLFSKVSEGTRAVLTLPCWKGSQVSGG